MAIFCRSTRFSPLTKALLGLIPAPEVEDLFFEEKQRAHVLQIAATSKLPVRLLSDLPMAGLAWRIWEFRIPFWHRPSWTNRGNGSKSPEMDGWNTRTRMGTPIDPIAICRHLKRLRMVQWSCNPQTPPSARSLDADSTMETKNCVCSIVQLQCYGSLWI